MVLVVKKTFFEVMDEYVGYENCPEERAHFVEGRQEVTTTIMQVCISRTSAGWS